MAGTDIAVATGQDAEQRLPIGLLISTGEPKRERGPGRAIDHFRFKNGDQEQYAEAADKAREAYGEAPKQLDEVILLSNRVFDVLEVRYKAWREGGFPVVWGKTNFAAIDDLDEFLARIDAWDDEAFYYPRKVNEVPARLREQWQGEPIEFTFDGPQDPRVKKYQVSLEATLKFGLPRALGLGAVALYSTKSRKNIRNLYEGLWFAHRAFQGNVVGIPFRLRVEPRKTSYFHPGDDKEPKGYRTSNTFQVTFTTPFTMQEAIDAIRERHEALGTNRRLELEAGEFFRSEERDMTEDIMRTVEDLRVPADDDTLTREEPQAIPMITDAQKNRVARLEEEYGQDTGTLLFGAYGVESVEQLTEEQADVYEQSLRRLIKHAQPGAAAIEGDSEDVETSFDDMLPDSVKNQLRLEDR